MLSLFQSSADLFDIDENNPSYSPYSPPSIYPEFSPVGAPKPEPFPFSLETISESFHELALHENPVPFQTMLNGGTLQSDMHNVFDMTSTFNSTSGISVSAKPNAPIDTSTCSVCGLVPSSSIAVLEPCSHPLCSACLTSALNIVGEKDMECSVCKCGVKDFRLGPVGKKNEKDLKEGDAQAGRKDTEKSGLLPSALENGFQPRSASTPAPRLGSPTEGKENVVLRIDNVPWVCHNSPDR
jgi:hypothetical protein